MTDRSARNMRPNASEIHGGYIKGLRKAGLQPLISEVDAFTVAAGQTRDVYAYFAASFGSDWVNTSGTISPTPTCKVQDPSGGDVPLTAPTGSTTWTRDGGQYVMAGSFTAKTAGDYRVEQRMLLSVEADFGGPAVALNEAVLEKTPMGHMVRLSVYFDGDFFTTYAADGLIVATPTGSTAYSFSARGPIVAPTHRCQLLTPVSPHMLFDRTLVLEPEALLRITVNGHRDDLSRADLLPRRRRRSHPLVLRDGKSPLGRPGESHARRLAAAPDVAGRPDGPAPTSMLGRRTSRRWCRSMEYPTSRATFERLRLR